MAPLTVYAYDRCQTCRRALRWLDQHAILYQAKPIREQPPSLAELKHMLAAQGGQLRRLFNTSGVDYRALGLGAKLGTMSEGEALALLAGNGNLVKRPFVPLADGGLVGFDAAAWNTALGAAAGKAGRRG